MFGFKKKSKKQENIKSPVHEIKDSLENRGSDFILIKTNPSQNTYFLVDKKTELVLYIEKITDTPGVLDFTMTIQERDYLRKSVQKLVKSRNKTDDTIGREKVTNQFRKIERKGI